MCQAGGYYTKVKRTMDYSEWYSEFQLAGCQKERIEKRKKRIGYQKGLQQFYGDAKKKVMVPRGPRMNKNETKQASFEDDD